MAKNKHPKQLSYPTQHKTPKNAEPTSDARSPVFSFKLFDDFDWHVSGHQEGEAEFQSVVRKLRDYEKRSWNEIKQDRNRDHPVSADNLIKSAQERLRIIRQDDASELWRFRFNSRQRIWGIKVGNTLQILWWDPHHQICPSTLKNT